MDKTLTLNDLSLKQVKTELLRRSLPKSDPKRAQLRRFAIENGLFTHSRADLKAFVASKQAKPNKARPKAHMICGACKQDV